MHKGYGDIALPCLSRLKFGSEERTEASLLHSNHFRPDLDPDNNEDGVKRGDRESLYAYLVEI